MMEHQLARAQKYKKKRQARNIHAKVKNKPMNDPARSGMGSWPSSGTQLMNIAFDNRFFAKRGFVSMFDIWNDRAEYRRTALVRNRMPGGVEGR